MSQPRPGGWLSRLFSPAPVPETAPDNLETAGASEVANNRGALFAGAGGTPADYEKAVECFSKAAEAGYALAQNNLGMMFASGRGVGRSDLEAGRWFRRAAEQGDAGGQFNLGNLCHPASLGRLVAEPGEARIQAYMWFSLAAAQGYDKAEASCETLNMQMSNAELDESSRRRAAFLPREEKPLACDLG